jgi:hypothetical protein
MDLDDFCDFIEEEIMEVDEECEEPNTSPQEVVDMLALGAIVTKMRDQHQKIGSHLTADFNTCLGEHPLHLL